MLLLSQPSEERIAEFLSSSRCLSFSYSEVGASEGEAPRGYNVDHNRAKLGSGARTFGRAVEAIRSWQMFKLDWVRLFGSDRIAEGVTVAVLARHCGFWSLNAARLVYVIDEVGPISKFGFAYGTLSDHVERGEERFSVEWSREDDQVWYDLFAFSRPNHFLAVAGYPFSRLLQKRFAADSKRAMMQAVNAGDLY